MGFFSRFIKSTPKPAAEPVSEPPSDSTSEPASELAIDPSTIEMLRELQEEDGPDLVVELFGVFFDDVPKRLQEIENALSAGDAKTVAFVAHGLKSSSGNLGCLPFSALCKKLEDAGRQGDLGPAPTLYASLCAEYQRVQASYGQSYQKAA